MPAQVFICYATQDRAVAQRLCASLEGAGLTCWMAPRDIPSGQSYAGAIVDAISSVRHFILVFSERANHSRHVANEVERAFSQGLTIHPLRLDATSLSPDLEYFVSRPQWVDLFGGKLEERIAQFTRDIIRVAGAEAASGGAESATTPAESAATPAGSDATAAPVRATRRQRALESFDSERRLEAPVGRAGERGTSAPEVRTSSAGPSTKVIPANIRICHAFGGHRSGVQCVAYSPDGALIASGTEGGIFSHPALHLWRARDGKLLRTFTTQTSGVTAVAFSPDGSLLASGDQFGATLWDAATGKDLRTLDASFVNAVAFSPDGRLLAVGSHADPAEKQAGLDVWRVANGRRLHRLPGHVGHVLAVAFSPCGTVLASGGTDKTVRRWSVRDGTLAGTLLDARGEAWRLTFLPDGASLLVAGGDKGLFVWDPTSGSCRAFRSAGPVASVAALSPCGTTVATGCTDGKIRLYRLADRKLLRSVDGPMRLLGSNRCRDVAFSPDGITLASAWDDKHVRIWALT